MKWMYVCPIAFRRRAASLILLLCAAVAIAPLSASSRQSAAPLEAAGGIIVNVSTEAQLQSAVASLTSDTTIVIAPGTYTLSRTLTIAGGVTNVVIRGATANPGDVVLAGRGAGNADFGAVPNGISVGGGVRGVTIAYLTIRDVYGHAILLAAGTGSPRITNVHLVNAGQQFIRVAAGGAAPVDDGILEDSLIEATSPSAGGRASGIEIEGGSRWTVRYNVFRHLQAGEGHLASPAVLVRAGARETVVEANSFVNCQQEIALGSTDGTPNDHSGGIVRNNFIARVAAAAGGPAISIADSPGAQVLHNTIFTNGSGSRIELRFPDTTGVVVLNNLTDGEIASRDGAAGTVTDNYTTATAALFADAASGDLHLVASATAVMDRVGVAAGASGDWDGEARPQGGSADYGADEYSAGVAQASAAGLTSTSDAQATTPTIASEPSSSTASAIAAASTLPAPWATADVGNPTPAGSATYASDIFTVQGGGPSIGGNADQFRFVYQTLDGDGEIVARLTDIEKTHPWAKAGVMFRDELTAGSRHAFAFVAAGQGPGFEYRPGDNVSSSQTTSSSRTIPAFVKLTRRGNTFTAYTSTNGTAWNEMGTQTISMNAQVYVGLAVSSRSTKALATATFDGVSVAGTTTEPDPDPDPANQAPSVALTAPASGASFTAPTTVQLTATAADADGSIAQVDFYVGGTLVGSDTTSPYTASWNAGTAGPYTLTAAARDNDGAWTTSAPVSVTVQAAANKPPAVSLTAPANGATFTAPANITLTATASDSDGAIARVDFYAGSTLLGSDTTSPYSFTWSGAAAGTYSLTARATDNSGATTTSSAVSVTVGPAAPLPRYVVFTASPDHNTMVTSYTVEFFVSGANPSTATPVRTQSIGKPTPVNGEIQADVAATIQALPSGTYVSTVKATGNGGSSRSSPSAPFVR